MSVLSTAKIVLNGAIDMSGRGSRKHALLRGAGRRIAAAFGPGQLSGGHEDGQTIVTYGSPEQAVSQVKTLLEGPEQRLGLARAGHEMVSTRYSKEVQWKRFEALVASDLEGR